MSGGPEVHTAAEAPPARAGRPRRHVGSALVRRGPGALETALAGLVVLFGVALYAHRAPWVHVREVKDVALSADMLAPFGAPARIVTVTGKVVDVATGDELSRLEPPEGRDLVHLSRVAVSRDGALVAGTLAPTREEEGAEGEAREEEGEGSPYALSRRVVHLWDAGTGRHLRHFTHPGGESRIYPSAEPAFSPDGARLLTEAHDRRLWDVATGAELLVMADNWWGNAAAFSHDGTLVAHCSGADGPTRIYEAATGKLVEELPGRQRSAVPFAFSPDSSRLLLASSAGAMEVWDRRAGRSVMLLPGRLGAAVARWSEDGTLILTAHWRQLYHGPRCDWTTEADHRTRLWDAETGEQVLLVKGCSAGHLSPDVTRIAMGLEVGPRATVAVWDARTGEAIARLPTESAYALGVFRDDNTLYAYQRRGEQLSVGLWRRRRPERWWGHAWRVEFWLFAALAAALAVQVATRRRAEARAASRTKRSDRSPGNDRAPERRRSRDDG